MKMKNLVTSFKSQVRIGLFLSVFSVGVGQQIHAQTPALPASLKGEDLSRFDFFYAGESKLENMYIVRKGKIVWSYTHPGKGEISDAVMLSNGNVLFAHQFAITEVNQKKEVVWNYDAPANTEIHTAQPIGKNLVIFVQNSNPAKIYVINKKTNKMVKELTIEAGNPSSTHGQFRHARLTKAGTYLVSHMDKGKVCEYDSNGKLLLTIDAPGLWGAEEIANGNILIAARNKVSEVNRKSEVVWEYPLMSNPDFAINSPQIAIRLKNGNTIVNNWFNQWSNEDVSKKPLQAIELTPDKKVVWAMRSWVDPANLGPSTIITPLNEPRTTEKAFFGDIH